MLLSRRPPVSVTVTMSSIRTPNSPGEVDARLDGEAHPGHQRLLLALDHVRRFVRGGADAVAGAVDELLAVPRVGDHLPGGPVDLLARDARPDRLDARLLGLPHDLVHLADLGGRLADADGAAGVRAVAVHQAAEVEDDRVARLDRPVAGLVVRVGAVRAGADDGEVDLLVPELAQQPRQVGGDVGLLPAGEPDPEDLLVRRVRGGARRSQPGQLVGVLDRAEHGQALGQRAVRGSGQRVLQPEQVHRPRGVRDRPWSRRRAQVGAGLGERVLAVGPVHDREARRRPTAASASGRSRVGTSSVGSRSAVRTSTVSRSVIAVGR